jgi:site-specific DNA-adenine methylase
MKYQPFGKLYSVKKNKWLDRISFKTGDAFEVLEQNIDNDKAYFFIDPPYTVAGKRLYT